MVEALTWSVNTLARTSISRRSEARRPLCGLAVAQARWNVPSTRGSEKQDSGMSCVRRTRNMGTSSGCLVVADSRDGKVVLSAGNIVDVDGKQWLSGRTA